MMHTIQKFAIGILAIIIIFTIGSKSTKTLAQTPSQVYQVAWSPNGTTVASVDDSGLNIWETTSGSLYLVEQVMIEGGARSLGWSPDGTKIAIGRIDRRISVWDTVSQQLTTSVEGHGHFITAITWSSNGSQIFSFGVFEGGLFTWDASSLEFVGETSIGGFDIDISPDGSIIVEATEGGVFFTDVATGRRLTDRPDYDTAIHSVDWNPNPEYNTIAVGSADGTVRIWDGSTFEEIDVFQGHTAPVTTVAFDSSGTRIASADRDGNIRLWDVGTGVTISILEHTGSEFDWSPNGTHLAFANTNDQLQVVCVGSERPEDLSEPVLRTPCDVVNDSIWPTYSWWAADNADWYLIYVRDLPGNTIHPFGPAGLWVEAAQVCNGDICEFRPTDGLEDTSPNYFGLSDGSYEWSLRSYDSTTGDFPWWQPNQAFDVVNPVPTLIAPNGDVSLDSGYPTYTWTPVADADRYHLWAGGQDSTTLIDIWLQATDVCDEHECQYQSREQSDYLYGTQHNGQYRWGVRANNSRAGITGAWQSVNFSPPPSFIINQPIIDTVTSIISQTGRQGLTLTWQERGYGDFYHVWIGDANQQEVFSREWFYHQDVCVEGACSLTLYFDQPLGVGRKLYLGAINTWVVVEWSAPYPLTVVEPPGEMMAAEQPPEVSVLTPDSIGTDETTDEFVPPSTLEPPDIIQTYPDICGDNPLCDSPFGDE